MMITATSKQSESQYREKEIDSSSSSSPSGEDSHVPPGAAKALAPSLRLLCACHAARRGGLRELGLLLPAPLELPSLDAMAGLEDLPPRAQVRPT